MVNLFASLDAAAGALKAFREGLSVSQNNVANATTPGYARQDFRLQAREFQPLDGLPGGVAAGGMQDSRNAFTEKAVRQQSSAFANFAQQTAVLSQIESLFDVSGEAGLPAAFNRLFDSFAAFSSAPNSPDARQAVIAAAGEVADGFNRTAEQLARISATLDTDLRNTVESVNRAAAQIQVYNQAVLRGGELDPGLQAVAFADAEALSALVNVDVLVEQNGTMTVLLGGQTPLVIGERTYSIAVESFVPGGAVNPGAAPSVRIVDPNGRDITATISGGELKGLLHARTQVLPSLAGDSLQAGGLNELAQGFADRVNDILTSGAITAGPPATPGVALFSYDPGSAATVARTLALDAGISGDQLAAISVGPPYVSNGAALALADLRSSTAPADTISGVGFLDFYASLARGIGDGVKSARQDETRASLLLTQARDLRSQASGVSLDQEAVRLTELQRSFEANSQVVRIVDEMLENVLSMIR